MLIYFIDATVRAKRRGQDWERCIVSVASALFVLAALSFGASMNWGLRHAPISFTPIYFCILLVIGFRLSSDAARAGILRQDLRENETQLAMAVDAARVGIFRFDLIRDEVWFSDMLRELYGYESKTMNLEGGIERIHPEDRPGAVKAMEEAIAGSGIYNVDFRIQHPDGTERWMTVRGRVEYDSQGVAQLIRGTSLDITALKQMQLEAQELSGRLIHAQEDERARLARDLHDDISQTIALLSIEFAMVGRRTPNGNGSIDAEMKEVSTRLSKLSVDLYRLSHKLHPTIVEQLGLVSAIQEFCNDIGSAHNLHVDFIEQGIPRTLSPSISLALYRIVQESVQNIVKHSGASNGRVTLIGENGEIRLEISDDGQGFDPLDASQKSSLGLVSMRERVRLLKGSIKIDSSKDTGTRIEAAVPVS